MTLLSSDLPTPQPFPRLSQDWRFLLPIPEGGEALLLCRSREELPPAFSRLGIRTVACFADPRALIPSGRPPGDGVVLASASALPFPPQTFDLVLAPRGMPLPSQRWPEAARALLRLLRPGGALLLGFSGRFRFRGAASGEMSASPRRVVDILRRVGYTNPELYGVMPDLDVPEYIFPFSPYALAFVLRSRYRRHLPAWWPEWGWRPFLMRGVLLLLPAWYVLARVPEEREGEA